MAIDTTPSTVATNALQAIPFSSLIGGPLEACIKAQALAAKTSWEFINEVGLTIDPDTGEKKAINVTFQYNNNGQLTTLVVPLLVIVPIPYLAIDTVAIDFMANISAASSSVTETSSDSSLGVDVTAEAAFRVGPFSLSIKANANYSSKQASKASQDSRYSVEYTMKVQVTGGQSDMPAGLSAILNILQGSITSVNPADMMQITPASFDLDQALSGTLQITVKTSQGIVAPGCKVKIMVEGDNNPFKSIEPVTGSTTESLDKLVSSGTSLSIVDRAYRRRYYTSSSNVRLAAHHQGRLVTQVGSKNKALSFAAQTGNNEVTAVTDKNGTVIFRLTLKEEVYKGTNDLQGNLLVTADVPVIGQKGAVQLTPETQAIPYTILPFGPSAINILTSASSITFAGANNAQEVTLTATEEDNPGKKIGDLDITVNVDLDGSDDASTVFQAIKINGTDSGSAIEATGKTAADGTVKFTFTTAATITKEYKGIITVLTDKTDPLLIPFTINKP